jgi:hypothetical protein
MLFSYKNVLVLKILFFGSVLFQNCSFQKVEKVSPAINTIKNGENFRINLPETHADGKNWYFKDDFNKKSIIYLQATWHGPDKGIDFNFEATAPGIDTLRFTSVKYRDTFDVKTFIVKVE